MDAVRFPAVTGEALDGTPFVTPRDLAGGRTVVFVAFGLEHRAEVESWVCLIDSLVRSRDDVRARLLAVIGAPKLMRKPMVAAMKAAATKPEQRASTIPLFVDVEAFARSLGIADRSHLAILVVLPDGRISWRGSGPYSDAAGAALREALA